MPGIKLGTALKQKTPACMCAKWYYEHNREAQACIFLHISFTYLHLRMYSCLNPCWTAHISFCIPSVCDSDRAVCFDSWLAFPISIVRVALAPYFTSFFALVDDAVNVNEKELMNGWPFLLLFCSQSCFHHKQSIFGLLCHFTFANIDALLM